ncbi:MAG TPA: hypothetical protein VI479_09285 [Blastocatellia bacterium]
MTSGDSGLVKQLEVKPRDVLNHPAPRILNVIRGSINRQPVTEKGYCQRWSDWRQEVDDIEGVQEITEQLEVNLHGDYHIEKNRGDKN